MRVRKQTDEHTDETIKNIVSVSDALAHPARINMYRYILLKNIERTPVRNKDIVEEFSYSQATVSQHLSKLIIGGLITVKNEGTSSYYYINNGKIDEYTRELKILE